jgi:hypothetical protein
VNYIKTTTIHTAPQGKKKKFFKVRCLISNFRSYVRGNKRNVKGFKFGANRFQTVSVFPQLLLLLADAYTEKAWPLSFFRINYSLQIIL